ncbi:TetR/AcrR family transcriptional regulator [Persephonella atlantica]|uniref:TetR/AcrR family transcriptional regulator n=1 Tax=Persephonella atlantica TaxID=2699429 RepID=A0ABS1GJC7_9AQUI|nr:TetR/AcrR family transcriptional regulator [Persephonella atlantica]MBK3333038.1 TetR/AcrR family transcriptional regulator [Persephonella atlantica]
MVTDNVEKMSTKEKIIKIGAEIIVKEGLRKFTAKNIADKLGITDAAIFKHFKSMDDIILEIIQRYVSRCSQSAIEAVERGRTVKEKLELLLKAHIDVLEDTRGAVPVLCFELSRSEDEKFKKILNNFVESYTKEISQIIKDGQLEGSIRKELVPEDVAMFFIGSIQAKVFAYVISGREGKIIEDPDQFISMIFYGIMEK